MKTVVLLLWLLPCRAAAQEIILVDRNLKRPVALTRKLTPGQLMNKAFPIYKTDLDSIIRITEALSHYINTGIVHKEDMQLVPVGHSQFAITTKRSGVFNSYIVYLSTRSGNLGASLKLIGQEDNNRQAVQQLLLFVDYLKNNRHIVETPDSR